LIHAEAKYSDLFEWQLYNAAAVGMGLGGDCYLYNNPLLSRGGITRRSWFLVPCCPSNLSRTWASLGKYTYSREANALWVHQYIGNEVQMEDSVWKQVKLESSLPWEGKVKVTVQPDRPADFTLHLRIPSWAGHVSIKVNGSRIPCAAPNNPTLLPPASGYDPRLSYFLPLQRRWLPGDCIDLDIEMPLFLRKASPHLHGHRNKVALSRGPLVYCVESTDNPGFDILHDKINPQSIGAEQDQTILGGIYVLRGKKRDGGDFTAIPYQLWANRGESQMAVWLNT
jgi:DUF1680 family protein